MPSDGGYENALCALATNALYDEQEFYYQDRVYIPVLAGKPKKEGGGEPKTDVFIRGENIDNGDLVDFRISVKKSNYGNVESHMTAPRYQDIFGSGWENVIDSYVSQRWSFFERCAVAGLGQAVRNRGRFIFSCGWEGRVTTKPSSSEGLCFNLPRNLNENLFCGNWDNSDVYLDEYGGRTFIEHGGYADLLLIDDYIPDTVDELLAMTQPTMNYAATHDTYLNFTQVNASYDEETGTIKNNLSRFAVVPVEWDLYDSKDRSLNYKMMFGRLIPNARGRSTSSQTKILNECFAALEIASMNQLLNPSAPRVREEPLTPWQEESIRMGQPDMDLDMLIYGTGIDLSYEGFYEEDLYDSYDEWEAGDYFGQMDYIQDFTDRTYGYYE